MTLRELLKDKTLPVVVERKGYTGPIDILGEGNVCAFARLSGGVECMLDLDACNDWSLIERVPHLDEPEEAK